MTQREVKKIVTRYGVYRLYWIDGGFSFASIGQNEKGDLWFCPSNWLDTYRNGTCALPCYKWKMVEQIEVIECA